MTTSGPGHCLLVYRSPIINESRLFRMAGSIGASGLVDTCHIVGCAADQLPTEERPATGIVVVRLGETRRRRGLLADILASMRWSAQVVLRYRRENLAAVCAHSVATLPLCWFLARLHACVLVYNPHELESRTPSMAGVRGRVARLVERLFIGRAAVVSTVNESIADWYAASYPIEQPVAVRNVPVVGPGTVDLRPSIGVSDDEFLYVHTGHLVGGRNIPLILRTFEELPGHSTAHVVFVGAGPLEDDVKAAATRSRRIHWLPPVPPTAVVDLVRQADAAFSLIDLTSDSYRYSSPNKMFEALMASVPPVCSDLIEARKVLGPEADHWVLHAPQSELAPLVERTSRDDVRRFRERAPALGTWEDEVAPLVERIRAATRERSDHRRLIRVIGS
jgi:glycosyltransferase involved in cell wall biosynthesis